MECEGDSLPALIEKLSPDVVVEGGEKPESQPGAESGLVTIALDPGYSTTALINRIANLRHHSA